MQNKKAGKFPARIILFYVERLAFVHKFYK